MLWMVVAVCGVRDAYWEKADRSENCYAEIYATKI